MGDSTCVACGECVQACPTGALMEATVLDDAQHGDSADYDEEVQSVCPFCGVGCQVSLKVKDGAVKYVDGINGPANEGRLCVKGRFGFDYIHHPHRLTKPLIRRDDAPAKGLNVDPGNWDQVFREAELGRGAGYAAAGSSGSRTTTAAPRSPASAAPNAPMKRRICFRNSSGRALATTTSITARGCAMPPRWRR